MMALFYPRAIVYNDLNDLVSMNVYKIEREGQRVEKKDNNDDKSRNTTSINSEVTLLENVSIRYISLCLPISCCWHAAAGYSIQQ